MPRLGRILSIEQSGRPAVTYSADRLLTLAQKPCSEQAVCLLPTRARMDLSACLAAPVLRCRSCSPQDQKSKWSSCARLTRTAGPSVNRWPSLQSLPAVPIRALTICSETYHPSQILVSVC